MALVQTVHLMPTFVCNVQSLNVVLHVYVRAQEVHKFVFFCVPIAAGNTLPFHLNYRSELNIQRAVC